jgi:hypothetical protein
MAGEIRTQNSEVFVVDPSATGSEIIKIGNITERGVLGGEPANIDITNLDSARRVSMPGLESDERFTVTVNLADGDEGHEWLEDNAGSVDEFEIVICDSTGTTAPTYAGTPDPELVVPTDRNCRTFMARIAMFQLQAAAPDGVESAIVGFDITTDVTVTRSVPPGP